MTKFKLCPRTFPKPWVGFSKSLGRPLTICAESRASKYPGCLQNVALQRHFDILQRHMTLQDAAGCHRHFTFSAGMPLTLGVIFPKPGWNFPQPWVEFSLSLKSVDPIIILVIEIRKLLW